MRLRFQGLASHGKRSECVLGGGGRVHDIARAEARTSAYQAGCRQIAECLPEGRRSMTTRALMALMACVLAFVADARAIRSARIISTLSAEARGRLRALPDRTAAA